ncbi:eclosion hormone-like [Homalodisca vitripennis]|uniref:eclosion hormone-like n=1 Tax=Homalodisca vitripennis TaxID=197043 RepID=UPI001EEBBB29|nr:eclosion hormone-like isoform X3 [Homalodisca vitripennis]XP_046673738.1 eclosion hormone-like isoform X3 [Homalodisca vitripennis]XP_046675159.1 eclosion hormone-like [Homalodisca vitripennis]XP_046675160.1 eclosion hormone-like [Homalodisca vitripennis]KAG8258760.1 hypothetical protein J6590_025925 [Homalodisca vitripennis]
MELRLAVYTILACLVTEVTLTSISVCINNCGQCKEMLGSYFNGQACAEFCLATDGFFSPDCNNPTTVRNFLKRLH